MRISMLFLAFSLATTVCAQENKPAQKGLMLGISVGSSFTHIVYPSPSQVSQNQVNVSLPNIKIGYRVSPRTAFLVYLPSSIYQYKGLGRDRKRGFEAVLPAVQFQLKERFWLMAGAGLGLDAPVFYDVKFENKDEHKYHTGFATAIGAGYEFWKSEHASLDVQTRIHYGTARVPEGNRQGIAFSLGIGVNIY